MNLFEYAESYPTAPGYKRSGTSQAAAKTIDASTLRGQVLALLRRKGPLTADQCASELRLSPFSIRPRLTELARLKKIEDSGERRPNASQRNAIVWQVAP